MKISLGPSPAEHQIVYRGKHSDGVGIIESLDWATLQYVDDRQYP